MLEIFGPRSWKRGRYYRRNLCPPRVCHSRISSRSLDDCDTFQFTRLTERDVFQKCASIFLTSLTVQMTGNRPIFERGGYQLCRVQQWQPSKRGLNPVHEVASYLNMNETAIRMEVEIIFLGDGLLVN